MSSSDKRLVKVSSRLSKFIGAKATREKKLQAASMQAEFTLRDTLIMLCYLSRDSDPEIASKARTNLIPAARAWSSREDKPELPDPIREIVLKVLDKVGMGERSEAGIRMTEAVEGHIGLLGLGEIIQAIDHNSRTVTINLKRNGDTARVFTENGRVVGALAGDRDGLDALYDAFGWIDAVFRYTHEPPGPFRNPIKLNTFALVMNGLEHSPDEDPFEREDSLDWQVVGHLRVMNVFELAEIFEMNAKTVSCTLRREEAEGTLYFSGGRVINAVLGDMSGMDAACRLLAWPNATFEVKRGGEGVPDVIHIGMQTLIIEAMRLLDEGITVTDRIASELQLINELFEGQDVVTLPVLDKVRLVFGEDEQKRDILETDDNPLVRKALKVKISKTVHRYLSVTTDHEVRLAAAKGKAPLSTTEKLVLLSYLSRDDAEDIREAAKLTLESLDVGTLRKGIAADLHPAVMDFLIRETVRDETVVKLVASSPALFPETASYILEKYGTPEIVKALADNTKLIERSPSVTAKLFDAAKDDPQVRQRIEAFETGAIDGLGDFKVEGPLDFFGLSGLLRAALQGARSGTIVALCPGFEGRVFFKKGKIIGAMAGGAEGFDAVERIIGSQGVRFRYVLRTHFHVQNVESSALETLLNGPDAGPRLDERGKSGVRIAVGHPEVMDIFEVLAALEGCPVRMMVSVVCEEGTGEVYRDGTRILHAHVEGKEGPYESMAAMLAWRGSKILVRYCENDFPVTVDRSLSDFMTEALKEMPTQVSLTSRPGELPEWELTEGEYESLYHQIMEMGIAEKIKLAFMGSKEARGLLVRDPNKMVAVAVMKSPKIQVSEVESFAKSRSVCEDVLRQIAANREWMKSYSVRFNLVNNSKTPLPISLKLLNGIKETDLRKIGKSKDIPQVVAAQARRMAIRAAERH
jgi:hypothetical protein